MNQITSRFLNMNAGIIFLFTLMVSFNWYSSSDPSREILTSILNFTGEAGLLIWFYAICQKSVEVLKRRQKDFNIMKTYKYAALVVLVSIVILALIKNIDPATISTQSDFERGEAFTYKRILYGTFITLVIGVLLMYRNTVKLLSSAETGKEQTFSDYYKSFLLLLFLPWIAVWFIQPRVKKI